MRERIGKQDIEERLKDYAETIPLRQAAEILGWDGRTVRKHIKTSRKGNRVVVTKQALIEWLA